MGKRGVQGLDAADSNSYAWQAPSKSRSIQTSAVPLCSNWLSLACDACCAQGPIRRIVMGSPAAATPGLSKAGPAMKGAILLATGAFGLWELDALNELRLVRSVRQAVDTSQFWRSGHICRCSMPTPHLLSVQAFTVGRSRW